MTLLGQEYTAYTRGNDQTPGIMPEAARLYNQGPSQYYSGQTYADRDPLQLQANQGLLNYMQGDYGNLTNLMQQGVNKGLSFGDNQANQMATNTIDANYTEQNPYLDSMVQGAFGQMDRSFDRRVMPAIQSNAVGAGQVGSSRQGIAEGIAMSDLNQQKADLASSMYGQAYESERGRGLQAELANLGSRNLAGTSNLESQNTFDIAGAKFGMDAAGMMPQVQQAYMQPYSAMKEIGAENQQMNQMGINEAMDRHAWSQNAPYQNLTRYMGFVDPSFAPQRYPTAPEKDNSINWAGAAGGALAGYAFGDKYFGDSSYAPWLTGLLGAAGGGYG